MMRVPVLQKYPQNGAMVQDEFSDADSFPQHLFLKSCPGRG